MQQLLKSLHLLGVTLFLGNLAVTALWKYLADRTRNPAVVAHSQRLVTITDFAFTLPGAVLILVTGQWLAGSREAIFATPWLALGYALFIASGLLWLGVLVPLQWKQARMARQFQATGHIPANYWKLSRLWMVAGLLATLLPFGNLYVMVFKPS